MPAACADVGDQRTRGGSWAIGGKALADAVRGTGAKCCRDDEGALADWAGVGTGGAAERRACCGAICWNGWNEGTAVALPLRAMAWPLKPLGWIGALCGPLSTALSSSAVRIVRLRPLFCEPRRVASESLSEVSAFAGSRRTLWPRDARRTSRRRRVGS